MEILLSFVGKQDGEEQQEPSDGADNESLAKQGYVQLKDGHGKTALHYAAGTGNTDGVALLLQTDCSLSQVCDAAGMLPLHIALKAPAPSSALLRSLLSHVRLFPRSCFERVLTLVLRHHWMHV